MKIEKFKKELDNRSCSYKEEGNKIIVNSIGGVVHLGNLHTLPEGIKFSNVGDVYLQNLQTMPEGTVFSNIGDVDLRSLRTLPKGTTFSNTAWVNLKSLIGGWFDDWKGNIKGIDHKRLLNKMIELGLFDRK